MGDRSSGIRITASCVAQGTFERPPASRANFSSTGIVNLTGFAHLSGISGLRQVTGFQGLSFCGNDLKQPTSAQVDDADHATVHLQTA
jgi:hypothetical protein